jgi:hypothetical protein
MAWGLNTGLHICIAGTNQPVYGAAVDVLYRD